ncbi:hypothetical protein E2C01_077925 [Portunus trituberculatus]|uniref:Uncharacterized protein n=1 Tax=Portunus trituberculatus TaxID=210409 RepID=A0A5B7ICM3_PORTR|nr:hypothetical protein [Portunus trituberculatus]
MFKDKEQTRHDPHKLQHRNTSRKTTITNRPTKTLPLSRKKNSTEKIDKIQKLKRKLSKFPDHRASSARPATLHPLCRSYCHSRRHRCRYQ